MRTTVDLPDRLFREAKMAAAGRGVSLKELITRALERDLGRFDGRREKPARIRLPIVPSARRKRLRISNEEIEDLLG